VNWFLDNGGDPNCPAEYGLTPLSIAVEIARLGIVQKLFRHCASANTARYEGQLLHFAARRTDEFAIPVIRLVIDHCGREDINGLQWDGVWHQREYWHRIKGGLGTPLHEAAKVGRPDVVKLLLKDGADWNLLDSSNRTPVQTAEQEDNRLVADYLRRVMRDKKNESQGSKL
jgi:ankyrin repeat protein